MAGGMSVGGATRVTCDPILVRAATSERATREWRMSPTMPTLRPSKLGKCSRIEYRSSRAWVGCSWAPQEWGLSDPSGAPLPEGGGGLEHELGLAGRELVDREQVFDHEGPSVMTTESAPSVSASRTSTASRLEVGRFLPM